MSGAMRIRQNPRVASRVYEGLAEVITLDDPIRQHRLNAVGTRIWQWTEQGATLEELARRLSHEFAVDEATATRDADEFVRELARRGLLLLEE